MRRLTRIGCLALGILIGACSGSIAKLDACRGVTCSGHGACDAAGAAVRCSCDSGYLLSGGTSCVASPTAALGGCQMFPLDHVFNTPIDTLPVDAASAAYLATIGVVPLHLDVGATADAAAGADGIPYNVVAGDALAWSAVSYGSTDPSMSWDPTAVSDCAAGVAHALVAPCTPTAAPQPLLPIPASPLVEGGIVTDPTQPYGDHHLLVIDRAACRLWEVYHSYPSPTGGWDIFGSASWDLASNALRPADWLSADSAGLPILPLLARADEAATGEIRHALRVTIWSSKTRDGYSWPARHATPNGDLSASKPPKGQLFRLKASVAIPATYNAQATAILQALKTYGMYLADGGGDMYVSGDVSAAWLTDTVAQVAAIDSSQLEAVDVSPIQQRAGFDPSSARVPPP